MARRNALDVSGLRAGYGRTEVVFGVDLHVGEGEIVALVGHNGAGKTTTLQTIFGLLPALGGRLASFGRDCSHATPRRNVRAGMSLIPSERFVFPDLTVRENLQLGALHAATRESAAKVEREIERIFPALTERKAHRAGTLSGGQQRMLSLGIALMSGPRLLLLDEPSLGLAPAVVVDIFAAIRRLADTDGLSVMLLEQNIGQALTLADRFYVMRGGRLILEESRTQMAARRDYWDLF